MRELKFRVWDNEYREKGGFRYISMIDAINWLDSGDVFTGDFDLKKIQQFTGLKDKNGKDIYEGDILKETTLFHTDGDLYLCNFAIEGYHSVFRFNNIKKEWYFGGHVNTYLEIIGNVFENPELMRNERNGQKSTVDT